MEWQKLRLRRLHEQDIVVTSLDCVDNSFFFHVQGLSGDYMLEIDEDASLWPPRCDCEDKYWRPEICCKHIILCLAIMGVAEHHLEDCYWQPQQDELYDILSKAHDCVGCSLAHDTNTDLTIRR